MSLTNTLAQKKNVSESSEILISDQLEEVRAISGMKLINFIIYNFKMPKVVIENEISGLLVAVFTVEKSGEVT